MFVMSIPTTTLREVHSIRCAVAVRYDEDDMPRDYPHRTGDMWTVNIDLETGQIADWPKDVPARKLHMKVCDQGTYTLLSNGATVAEIENDYVPCCVPGSYGDYIEFNIDENGRITNWGERCTQASVQSAFFGDSAARRRGSEMR